MGRGKYLKGQINIYIQWVLITRVYVSSSVLVYPAGWMVFQVFLYLKCAIYILSGMLKYLLT